MKANQRQRMAEYLFERVRGATWLELKDWENGEAPFWKLVAALDRLFLGVKPLSDNEDLKAADLLNQRMRQSLR